MRPQDVSKDPIGDSILLLLAHDMNNISYQGILPNAMYIPGYLKFVLINVGIGTAKDVDQKNLYFFISSSLQEFHYYKQKLTMTHNIPGYNDTTF